MDIEKIFFIASIFSLVLVIVLSVILFIRNPKKGGKVQKRDSSLRSIAPAKKKLAGLEVASLYATVASWIFITLFLVARTVRTGHGPFTSMYEFTIAFVWGILLMGIYFAWRYQTVLINFASILVSIVFLFIANSMSSEAAPLMPALQNSLLLSVHVASAVIAYGSFTIGFIASLFYMINERGGSTSLPDKTTLETISYHSVVIGFPFMTLVIVLGAIWADIAWGRFWSWDPKETASLVTWLIYAVYLHMRVIRKWRGKKAALILIIGFIAIIFTFFGNYFFSGLHSYV